MPSFRLTRMLPIIISGILICTCCLPCHARRSLADDLSRLVGFTILTSSYVVKSTKELDSSEVRIQLANGMSFSTDDVGEFEAESLSGNEAVVLARQSTMPGASPVYRLVIEEEIHNVYRRR